MATLISYLLAHATRDYLRSVVRERRNYERTAEGAAMSVIRVCVGRRDRNRVFVQRHASVPGQTSALESFTTRLAVSCAV